MDLFGRLPVVQAPMAGGPSTPQLCAAVNSAGGFGFVAGGYLGAEQLATTLEATRALTGEPFGVNLFTPSAPAPAGPVEEYARTLAPEARRLGVPLGAAAWDDDAYAEKLDLLMTRPVHLVSFTFGCPDVYDVERLHSAEMRVAVTVTSVGEAIWAQEAGVDALILQGAEAGGHQGTFLGEGPNENPLNVLLAEVRSAVPLPLVAGGGIMSAADVAAVRALGASAAVVGTALLCADEAGTSELHRRALLTARFADTVVTRAYTGRYARGLANRFAREHPSAPSAYPQIHHLTRPLRAAATAAGDDEVPNLWAGTGWRAVTAEPAAEIVRRLAGRP